MSQNQKFPVEISVIIPSRNEGANVSKVLEELIFELETIGKPYEIIALDSPSANPSYETFMQFADKYQNLTAVNLTHARQAGNDKAVKYMIGFNMARGKYIIHIDSDGQDNPADLRLFIDKLEDGFDLVVGHKQNRKDTSFYMLTSKISNTLTRTLTGVSVHDMNCGFKGYQHHVAKSLNIKGRWYRFIPAIVAAKGFSVTEVPIENRKREWGKTNFNFRNRLEGGLFDQLNIIILNKMGEAPAYFFGWLSLGLFLLSLVSLLSSLLLSDLYVKIFALMLSATFGLLGFLTVMLNILNEYWRSQLVSPIESYGIKDIYHGRNKES